MKTLIVNFSFTGNNLILAQEMRTRMNADILQVKEPGHRTNFSIFLDTLFRRQVAIHYDPIDLRIYDHIVFVAPIWVGKIASPLKSFLKIERESVRHYSFISVCSGVAGQIDRLQDELAALIGREATMVTELWIKDLLFSHKKGEMKYVAEYRLHTKDMTAFGEQISRHVLEVGTNHEV
jgi:hypothetical protein